MSGTRRGGGVFQRLPRLFLDAISVVFAVLIALAVDEWNEDREIREQAGRARNAVISELQSNQVELEAGIASSREMTDAGMDILRRLRRGEEITDATIQGSLPDFSDAAWETARVTGIVAHMEYDWVLETARVYETQKLIQDLQKDLFGIFGGLVVRAPSEERYADLVGQLLILSSMQEQLAGKIDSLFVGTPPSR